MYFEIENTPEHIRRARRKDVVRKESPKDELPCLVLAPFSRPPQVVFDNVLIGTSSERSLKVFNPSKQEQQITLGRALPPGLYIRMPEEFLILEPETNYCLSMIWTPTQPTALRETIRFTNENRGRYDVIVVLKSAMNIKGKSNQPKGYKTSPGRMKKKPSKKSPVAIYKKKTEVIYNTTKIKKTVNLLQSNDNVYKSSNKENISFNANSASSYRYNPFEVSNNCDIDTSDMFSNCIIDTSDMFSNSRKPKTNTEKLLQNRFDKPYELISNIGNQQNILKPANRQLYDNIDNSTLDVFDKLTFTPLKGQCTKNEKLDKGPKIILSMNSDSELDDSLNVETKTDETHSIICITSSQPPNKWPTANHQHANLDGQYIEHACSIQNKKIPNTSSPKELNSPNFSINTDFSRISDLSFLPQRFSTERKLLPKVNETHDLLDDMSKLNSDTYTKDSPSTPIDTNVDHMYLDRPPHYFMRDNAKMCRQSLFREYQHQREPTDRNHLNPNDQNVWQNDMKFGIKSPPRSITPPLQSIPEESVQFSDTQVLDNTDRQMHTFTINRTFDKEKTAVNRQSWSKKSIRAEPELWKVPAPLPRKSLKPKSSINSKDSLCGKVSNIFETTKSLNQNLSLNQIGNVYSQSFTVDPFLSTTYFYDEEAVDKFEIEFKRWLNCILTPPADLDSNIEQKIDVGKAWIENRNKEVPVAPTKEQVSSVYHNNHRLESVRRAARALLLSPEMTVVFQKLNAQIEKKLIAIRTDRNLHLDVGLQKLIMELLLSYNPLWLRIGLETIYGLVLPLKSNSDIEGLTTFIIQRMFKNPHLKNKHSKSSAPNMLLPAYMDAIKKFTLKKFFMLAFFLDQAKQRKLISHDPCLFCRNAPCKESRDIIIRFTRELIAGIGDITKHLRPLGYVVSHKQSYLDEYKYAVHNIALDIRDGVRLTKVMEIIMMKNGLLNQLRTPAISRLQKIHNVQVALNALKEANFIIVGDITANDIADGHREKTLSLLWQIIHVFRAPLFEKAANVIQTWWRKKYEVILEEKQREERLRLKLNNAASAIQIWWRRIQYNRVVELQLQQITTATLVIQKYCRMWLCRTRYRKLQASVATIKNWYKLMNEVRRAKSKLTELKQQRDELQHKSAIIIQSYVRRWLCAKQYKTKLQKIRLIQCTIRSYLDRKRYIRLRKSVIYIQQKYRSKLLSRKLLLRLTEIKKSAIVIQSYYRMIKRRNEFIKYKSSVKTIEESYIALLKMRRELNNYKNLRRSIILMQAKIRGKKCRLDYLKQRDLIIKVQTKVRANLLMKKDRECFLKLKNATVLLQNKIRMYLLTKECKYRYMIQKRSTIRIQQYFRAYILGKTQRNSYCRLRHATINLQKRFRMLMQMRRERSNFLKLKKSVIVIQRQYRAQLMMKYCKDNYRKKRAAAIIIQRRFRAQMKMQTEKMRYWKLKSSCVIIQSAYRAYVSGKRDRRLFLRLKEAAITIQNWFIRRKQAKEVEQQYKQVKQASVTIQRVYRSYIISRKQRQEYIRIRTATVRIQQYFRSYIEMKFARQQYIQLKTATVTIQRFYKSYLITQSQRKDYLKIKYSAQIIQNYFRRYRETKIIRNKYLKLKEATIVIQRWHRSLYAMQEQRKKYLTLKQCTITIQQKYRALLVMRQERKKYKNLLTAAKTLQTRFRANRLMKHERNRYVSILKACETIQMSYRSYRAGKRQREEYLALKQSVIIIQNKYRGLLAMRKKRTEYLMLRSATVTLQRRYRARLQMLEIQNKYQTLRNACITIQRNYKAFSFGRKQRQEYSKTKSASVLIQKWYRYARETKKIRNEYLKLKCAVKFIQSHFRTKLMARERRRQQAAHTIQTWYRSIQKRNKCRYEYLTLKKTALTLQATFRMSILYKKYLAMKYSAIVIQRFYRAYRLMKTERHDYTQLRASTTILQSYVRRYVCRKRFLRIRWAARTLQAAYKLKKNRDIEKKRRDAAALCLQKHYRRLLLQSWYQKYKKHIVCIQKVWRGKLVTRLTRCEFLQKRNVIIKLQAIVRGYLIRKLVQTKREELLKERERQRRQWAATKIQALFRGNKARLEVSHDMRIANLRRRWREGALTSTQESLKERNEEAMEVLRNMSDIETVIRAFRSLELLTEVFPMMYNSNASSIVRRVYIYMSVTNRSISSIEVLKSAASVLVNLARYRITGPKIYARDRIEPVLKFMWRFSNSETQLFCILCTYLWLFSKYNDVKEDLTECLHIPENRNMLVRIKNNIGRMKRMATNARSKFYTPQSSKFISHTGNQSVRDSSYWSGNNRSHSTLLPAMEPDYGIMRADKPRYFEDADEAITCLFHTYNLNSFSQYT